VKRHFLSYLIVIGMVLGVCGGVFEAVLDSPFGGSPAGCAVAQEQKTGEASSPITGAQLALKADPREKREISMREAIEAAFSNNLNIAIRRMDPESANFGVTEQDAQFDPLFGASGGYSEAKTEAQSRYQASTSKNADVNANISQMLKQGFNWSAGWTSYRNESASLITPVPISYLSALTLQFRQPLLRGFGFAPNTTSLEIAKLDVTNSEEGFRSAVIGTIGNVETAYWDLSASIFSYQVQLESLKLANDLLDLNRKKVEVGTLAPIQITEAEASVASREQSVIVAEATIRAAEDNLRYIMNVPPDSPEWNMGLVPVDRAEFEPKPIDRDEMIRIAMANRPEIKQAKAVLRQRELSWRFAQNYLKPGLDASGSYTANGNNFKSETKTVDVGGVPTPIDTTVTVDTLSESAKEVFRDNYWNWQVGLTFSLPIGNRNAKATEARARIAWEQQKMTVENTQRSLTVEVRNSVLSVETAAKAVTAARANVRLQEKKVEAEQKRYDNGMSTSFQVLTYQTDLTTARSQLISAMSAYQKSLVSLDVSTGRLLDTLGIRLASK